MKNLIFFNILKYRKIWDFISTKLKDKGNTADQRELKDFLLELIVLK